MKTWILVADRTRARLYERKGRSLELLKTIDHAEGRIEDQDIEVGRSSRTFDRHAQGRTAGDRGTSPHELSARAFAGQLAKVLERGRQELGVEGFVLVAEPHLLGMLRGALAPATEHAVVASLTKDLHAVADRDVAGHLEGSLPVLM